ncbi:hypothetical protein ACFY1A_00285 [Streptomyces sp. NPDC001520]|uniref:hypothetical protein n=1 Tax=Streptomyces sp. NPDC001520 TaxID=3364581 RepID=UPI00368BFB6E
MVAQLIAHGTDTLTPAQLDGLACVVCGSDEGPMVPVDVINGCQVFAHPLCVESSSDTTAPVTLVIGPVSTPEERDDVNSIAADFNALSGATGQRAWMLTIVATPGAVVLLLPGWRDCPSAAADAMTAEVLGAEIFEL